MRSEWAGFILVAMLLEPGASTAAPLKEVTQSTCESIGQYWEHPSVFKPKAGGEAQKGLAFGGKDLLDSDIDLLILWRVPVPEKSSLKLKSMVHKKSLGLHLISSAARGDLPAVKKLLAAGADPNFQSKVDDWATPLGWAAQCDHVSVLKDLVAGGGKINARFGYFNGGGHWTTPLIWASQSGAKAAVHFLLEAGADANVRQQDFPASPGGAAVSGPNAAESASDPEVRRMIATHLGPTSR